MEKGASKYFFLFLFLFSILTISSSATLIGFAYDARGNISASSLGLKLNNDSSTQIRVYVADKRVLNLTSLSNSTASSVDLYLNLRLVVDLMHSELSAISWLESCVLTFHPHSIIKSIILSCNSEEFAGKNVLPLILSSLKSLHSALNRIHLDMKVKVSIAFPLPLLESLNTSRKREMSLIFGFIKKTGSFVIIEAYIDEELIRKAIKATSVLPDCDILIEVVQIDELYTDVASMGGFVEKELIHLPRRELVNNLKTSIHDTTIFPTTPIAPDNNPTPTIVTVPATNPVTVTPANPVNPAAPITNPATIPAPPTVPGGAQPVTNPVTTYPPPAGNVPVTVTPPATTNAPAIPGQSWCVAKSGVSVTTLQQALDYACGIGGADCSLIQQGGSCYNPNTLQNHASYAFNSYYQKNPSPTSCEFGGTAMIVNTNPSTGSCVYPSSSPPSTPASASTPPAQPTSTTPPAATTTTPPGPGIPGSVTPPGVLNSSNPASVFGSDSPPSTSTSAGSQFIHSSLTLVTSFVTGIVILKL